MNPASPAFTMRTTVRAAWWKRPFLLLLGKPTRWIIEYRDCHFSSPITIRDGLGKPARVRVDFTAGEPTITPHRW